MMKFALLLVAVIGMTCAAPPATSYGLTEDFKDFLALIPVEKLHAITLEHLKNDAEVIQVVKYLQGPEWAKLINEIKVKPGVQSLVKYLTEAGIPVEAIIKFIHDLIANAETGKATRTVRSFLDAIKKEIPTDKILALAVEKLNDSPEFIALFEKISSEDAHKLVEEVRAIAEVQRLVAVLKDMGVDLTAVLEKIYEIFGWN